MDRKLLVDWLCCWQSPVFFTQNHVQIFNATQRDWIAFDLWPDQKEVLDQMQRQNKLVILKARQLGISWLSLAYALWLVLFRAPATVLVFSLKEREAVDLLNRVKGMYARLPSYLIARSVVTDNDSEFELSTGSRVLAFSTGGGRGYTASLAIVDEADFLQDLGTFLNAVKPTIDAGGQLMLISTANKKRPLTTFKNLFWAGRQEVGDYRAVFLPWASAPERTLDWYERTKAEMYAQRGTHDDFYAEYPATPEEALAPEQLDRRIPLDWIRLCVETACPDSGRACPDSGRACPDSGRVEPSESWAAPALPGLEVFAPAEAGRFYGIGADPAEGNPNSDESAACVLDDQWREVATLAGKFEPAVFAGYLDQLSGYYRHATVMVERNNHGHALLLALQESGKCQVLNGYDGKAGWLTNVRGKHLLYDICAQIIRSQDCTIRSPVTASQLASVEASTLSAPPGLGDDRAMAFALALAGLCSGYANATPSVSSRPPMDVIDQMDNSEGW